MENIIFYSWQSDLPNNNNRSFIEECIKKAIKNLSKNDTFTVELNIERDTKNTVGTPDIVETIFKKIDRAQVFIADISIINSDYSGKKTPNPNVLIELGYAAKTLGWEKIICFYNTAYGKIEDLPFDLRQRRLVTYDLTNKERSTFKHNISKIIENSMLEILNKNLFTNEINDYIKVEIDTEILTLINHLTKIIFNYSEGLSQKITSKFLDLSIQEIKEKIESNIFIGFQLYKSFEVNANNMKLIVDKTLLLSFSEEVKTIMIKIMKWIGSFDKFFNSGRNTNIFIDLKKENTLYKLTKGNTMNQKNEKYPNRYLLLKILGEDKFLVQDFGDFLVKETKLLNSYMLSKNYTILYSEYIKEFIEYVNKWLELTNGEFIIDNINNFEFHNSTI